MGRQLAGSRLGIIGYGSIGRYLAGIAKVLGMEVLVADPFATIDDASIAACAARRSAWPRRFCRLPRGRQ